MAVFCKTEEEIIVDTGDYNSDEGDDSIRLTMEDSGGEQHYTSSGYPEKVHQRNRNLQEISGSNMIPPGKNISKNAMENEKRMRREIANSNERRRMQSINAGFQSLRSLLPHHEGEKLSKAAILQQTSQYIIELEREKTHLLSQNSQLKRTLGQHEVATGASGDGSDIPGSAGGAIKKRKLADNVITLQTISDSSDEGLGSMSPEPITLLNNASKNSAVATTAYISTTSKELTEMKASLEAERKRRVLAEERLRQFTRQLYPATTASTNQYAVHRGEVIEHTDNIREEHEMAVSIINDPLKLQVVEIDALPAVGQTQVVVCSPLDDDVMDMAEDEEVVETITDEIIHEDTGCIIKEEYGVVEVPSRLQPILEAAIKAEPKVEVERINATLTKLKDDAKDASQQGNSGRMYLTSTSRQNLETIVEAIRHLEGDHLFDNTAAATEQQKKQQKVTGQAKVVTVQQEVPLALTNKPSSQRKQLSVDLSPFLQLKSKSPAVSVEPIPGTVAAVVKTSSSNNSSSSISSVGTNNSSSTSTAATSSNTATFLMTGSGTIKIQPTAVASVSSGASASTVSVPSSQSASSTVAISASSASGSSSSPSQQTATSVTIAAALKQCRPGVIVAKQVSS